MNQPIQKIKFNKWVDVTHDSRNVCTVYFDDVKLGWEQWILLSSDRHHDSKWCNRELELKHLQKAKERNALILDGGDLFDVMQGKFDPRRSYRDLRPEYAADDMLDLIVKDAASFFGEYAKSFVMIGRGNHDQKVLQTNGTDMVSNLVHRLNSDYGGKIQAGGYGGWVRFMFKIGKTQAVSKRLKYFHGSGGGGAVTRGTIQSNRQAVYLPDADIVYNGHTHDSYVLPIARERMSDQGVIYQDLQYHVRSTTYKNEYQDGADGWHVETWKPPKPLGATWLRFYHEDRTVKMDFIPDVI